MAFSGFCGINGPTKPQIKHQCDVPERELRGGAQSAPMSRAQAAPTHRSTGIIWEAAHQQSSSRNLALPSTGATALGSTRKQLDDPCTPQTTVQGTSSLWGTQR